ncbi:hypothetical protein L209DRAFT_316036 [Thermothelomyces heterothallicus CBS 203.75]
MARTQGSLNQHSVNCLGCSRASWIWRQLPLSHLASRLRLLCVQRGKVTSTSARGLLELLLLSGVCSAQSHLSELPSTLILEIACTAHVGSNQCYSHQVKTILRKFEAQTISMSIQARSRFFSQLQTQPGQIRVLWPDF